jgi:uncharacterized protein (DUF1330 family)
LAKLELTKSYAKRISKGSKKAVSIEQSRRLQRGRVFDREKVMPLIEKFGGRYLVRGGDVRRLEGNLPLHRLVVLEFPTLEAAQRFYDSAEYQPILKLRLDSTRSDVVLAQGYSQ